MPTIIAPPFPRIRHTYLYENFEDGYHMVTCKNCNYEDLDEHHDTDSDGFCDECEAELGTNYGSLEAPISVVQALKIAADECPNKNNVTKQPVVAKGVVVSIGETGDVYYKNITIRDESDANKTILIYTLNMTVGVDDPDVNDIITIEGYIKNFDGTIEFATNSNVFVNMRANTRGQSKITLGEHGDANVSGFNATEPNGSEVSLVITVPDGKKVTEVKVNGTKINAESDGKTYKFVVHGDAEITVTTADEGAGSGYYEKITSTSQIDSGAKYLLVCESVNHIFDGSVASGSVNSTSNTYKLEDGAIVGNKILATADLDNRSVTITQLNNGKYSICLAANYYIGNTGGKSKDIANATDANGTNYQFTISFNSQNVQIKTDTFLLGVNTGWSNGFRFYSGGSTPIQLYIRCN